MNRNGKVDERQEGEPCISIDGVLAIMADYVELIKANPNLVQPLTVIVQKRSLAEKDAEIAELKAVNPQDAQPIS